MLNLEINWVMGDIFTKSLPRSTFHSLCSKLGIFDLYAPARGGVLEFLVFFTVVGVTVFACDI